MQFFLQFQCRIQNAMEASKSMMNVSEDASVEMES